MIKRIQTIEELNELKARELVDGGTYNTAMHALIQGKPLFVAIPDETDGKEDLQEYLKQLEELGIIKKGDNNGLA